MFRFKSRVPEFEQKNQPSTFVLYKREASWLVAAIIIMCLFSFLVGYFLGQKKSAQSFMQQAHADAFVDQANSAIYSMQAELKEPAQEATGMEEGEKQEGKKNEELPNVLDKNVSRYFAILMTTDFFASASNLQEEAKKRGIELRIKQSSRRLKKARNKTKTTYQIVTGFYTEKDDLERDLEILKDMTEFKGMMPQVKTEPVHLAQ